MLVVYHCKCQMHSYYHTNSNQTYTNRIVTLFSSFCSSVPPVLTSIVQFVRNVELWFKTHTVLLTDWAAPEQWQDWCCTRKGTLIRTAISCKWRPVFTAAILLAGGELPCQQVNKDDSIFWNSDVIQQPSRFRKMTHPCQIVWCHIHLSMKRQGN